MTVSVYIGGVDRSAWFDKRTIAIEDSFGARGKTARATITVDSSEGVHPSRPLAGQVLRIVIDGVEEFEGPIVTVKDVLFNPDVYEAVPSAVDYVLWLDRKLVLEKIARPSELAGDRIKYFLSTYCTDFTEGTINDGDTVPAQAYDYVEMSGIMDELSEICGYTWWVDSDKKLYFVPEVTEVAPIAAIDLDTELDISDVEVVEDWSDLHNVLTLKDFKLYSEEYVTETQRADGFQTFFGLHYEPYSVETTQVWTSKDEGATKYGWTVEEDEAVTAGETGFTGEVGKVYLCISNWGLRFGLADPPEEDDVIYVNYAYTLEDQTLTVEDADSIAEMATRTGTDGRFEKTISSPNMKVASIDDATQYCQMLLSRGAWPIVRGSFTTFTSGWKSGQTFTVISAKRDIAEVKPPNVGDPVRVWVQSVTKRIVVLADGESIRYRSEVEFSSKPFTALMSMDKFFKSLVDKMGRNQPVGTAIISGASSTTSNIPDPPSTSRVRAILLEDATPDPAPDPTPAEWTTPSAVHSVCGEGNPVGHASFFIDGDTSTYWSHYDTHLHTIILDMGVSKTVERIRLYCQALLAYWWYRFDVYVSDDPAVWGAAVSSDVSIIGVVGWTEHTFAASKIGRYIKLDSIDTYAADNYVMGAEFEAYLTG